MFELTMLRIGLKNKSRGMEIYLLTHEVQFFSFKEQLFKMKAVQEGYSKNSKSIIESSDRKNG